MYLIYPINVLLMALISMKTHAYNSDIGYYENIEPILKAHCQECHSTGGIAPFSYSGYDNASNFIEFGLDHIEKGFMPPGIATSDWRIKGINALTKRELNLIRDWIMRGKPKGNVNHKPKMAYAKTKDTWDASVGRPPDMILRQSEPMHLGAIGADVYRNIVFNIGLDTDLELEAFQLMPGNRKVVHHAVLYYTPSDFADELQTKYTNRSGLDNPDDKSFGFVYPKHTKGFHLPKPHFNGTPRSNILGTYAQGSKATKAPDGTSFLIPNNSTLIAQVHYHRSGSPEDIASEVALWYRKGSRHKKNKIVENVYSHGDFIVIPKNVSDYKVSSTIKFKNKAVLIGMMPHAHTLATSMAYTLTTPDGTRKNLLEVPHWDFNWQPTYFFDTPIKINPGTTIHGTVTYNNTEGNSKNPNHPTKNIWNDESSTDEMFLTVFYIAGNGRMDIRKNSFIEFGESITRSQFFRNLTDKNFRFRLTKNGDVLPKEGSINTDFKREISTLEKEDLEDMVDAGLTTHKQ